MVTQVNGKTILLSFGEALRSMRHQAGISQEELANKAGLDRTYVGGVERGERNISLINLYKLSAALEISLSELFDEMNEGSRCER